MTFLNDRVKILRLGNANWHPFSPALFDASVLGFVPECGLMTRRNKSKIATLQVKDGVKNGDKAIALEVGPSQGVDLLQSLGRIQGLTHDEAHQVAQIGHMKRRRDTFTGNISDNQT